MIAELQANASRFNDALATLERAATDSTNKHNHFYEAEIARVRGEVLLAQSPDNAAAAETAFRDASELATQQSCHPLALRAATSLPRLLSADGRRDEARSVLAPVYGTFTEGFDWPDLQAAKEVLATL